MQFAISAEVNAGIGYSTTDGPYLKIYSLGLNHKP